MNLLHKKLFIRVLTGCFILASIVFVYWPLFTVEFGMHSDYTLIPGTFANHQVFYESRHHILVGRILNAILITFVSWFITTVRDFTTWRFISFSMLLLFSGLFVDFLRRRFALRRFWCYAIMGGLVFLPFSQFGTLTVIFLVPGLLVLVLVLLSYFLLEKGWPAEGFLGASSRIPPMGGRVWFLIAAAVIFLMTLFIYPPNSMFVFVCTFAVVLFSPLDQWRVTRCVVLRDTVFYVLVMVVYWVVNTKLIIPHVEMFGPLSVGPASSSASSYAAGGTYDMRFTNHLSSKWPLIVDTILIAGSGTWHLLWGKAGGWIPFSIIILSFVVVLVARKGCWSAVLTKLKAKSPEIFLIFMTGVWLFFLTNLPEFVAKGCTRVIGYRVLFPAESFFLVLQLGFIWHMARLCVRRKKIIFLQTMVVLWLLGAGWIAAKNISDVARNFNRELTFIREKISLADRNIDRIMVILLPQDQDETMIEHKMPMEFSYMTTGPNLVQPIVDEVRRKKGFPLVPVDQDFEDLIFFDDHTYVVDLNEARQVRAPESEIKKTRVLLTVSTVPNQMVEIFRQGDFFVFNQTFKGQRFPFWWALAADGGAPWFQMEFKGSAQTLCSFTFGVFGEDIRQTEALDCKLQASSDEKHWIDLDISKSWSSKDDSNWKGYLIRNPAAYKKYRFYLFPRQGHLLQVSAIHMVMKI